MSDQIPIQPVEQPVICKPYDEPYCHYEYDRATGLARTEQGRRIAAYWYKLPGADARQGQLALELEEDRRDLVLVNKLRRDVKRWRESNYEGATNVTKDLLRHWNRTDRARRFFFCQLEAAETVIFLNEIRGYRRDRHRGQPRWKPEFADDDFPRLWSMPDGTPEPLERYACKMATGSGKTVVMAMLIAWAFCNRGRVPRDDRFPNAVLVCCPNLTIKERLQVLRTDGQTEDYYRQFDIVPPQYRDLLRTGKVLISNWHFFDDTGVEHREGGRSFGVVNKGRETDEAFARNRIGELFDQGPIMVLNDEGHHAYRPHPDANGAQRKRRSKEWEEDVATARVWVEGLDRIAQSCGIRFCVDMSATPFYIKGSGYPEGEPFPWIVTEFGLVDAIESGITKIPRLPVSDTTGQPDPKYFRLWRNITASLTAGQRLSNRRPKPGVVWERAQDALVQLAGEYKKSFEAIEQSSDTALKAPPVMIVICDNTNIAELFFENISGQTEVEAVDETELEDDVIEDEAPKPRGKKPKKRIAYSAHSTAFPGLFENAPNRRWTIHIDSKRLEKIESEDPGASKDQAAQELRAVVNTVGKPGQPGQDVRCVVSVAMLNEGWDANTVTHILGIRAFGSQLLCEQVVGRGLRRRNYTPGTDGFLAEEYVDVYGIPFSVIPFKGKPSSAPPDRPVNHVHALPERAGFEIRFPNVENYVYALRKPAIKVEDFSSLEPLRIEPEHTPTATFLRIVSDHLEGGPAFGGTGPFVEHNRTEYYAMHHLQEIEFEIARRIVGKLVGEGVDAPVAGTAKMRGHARHVLFPQVLRIAQRYVREKVDFRGVNPCELGLDRYVLRVQDRLLAAIVPDEEQGETPLLPVLVKNWHTGTTADVNFTTKRNVHSTQRSHVNAVVLDSKWEQSAAFYLEQRTDMVAFYARNDGHFLTIPYEYEGDPNHTYEPDYLVRLTSGTTLILEIKGQEDDQDRAKYQAARRWVTAVNNWGRLGRWDFAVCRDPQQLPQELDGLSRRPAENQEPP